MRSSDVGTGYCRTIKEIYLGKDNCMSYKMIDLFAGCGGLEDGFLQSGKYEDIAAVEWLQPQVKTLINRLETKWGIKDAKNRVMCFDIQREDELFKGWSDDSKAPSREMLSNEKPVATRQARMVMVRAGSLCKCGRWHRYYYWWTTLSGLLCGRSCSG